MRLRMVKTCPRLQSRGLGTSYWVPSSSLSYRVGGEREVPAAHATCPASLLPPRAASGVHQPYLWVLQSHEWAATEWCRVCFAHCHQHLFCRCGGGARGKMSKTLELRRAPCPIKQALQGWRPLLCYFGMGDVGWNMFLFWVVIWGMELTLARLASQLCWWTIDRPNVQDQLQVERLQHTYVDALHAYVSIHHPHVSPPLVPFLLNTGSFPDLTTLPSRILLWLYLSYNYPTLAPFSGERQRLYLSFSFPRTD